MPHIEASEDVLQRIAMGHKLRVHRRIRCQPFDHIRLDHARRTECPDHLKAFAHEADEIDFTRCRMDANDHEPPLRTQQTQCSLERRCRTRRFEYAVGGV